MTPKLSHSKGGGGEARSSGWKILPGRPRAAGAICWRNQAASLEGEAGEGQAGRRRGKEDKPRLCQGSEGAA